MMSTSDHRLYRRRIIHLSDFNLDLARSIYLNVNCVASIQRGGSVKDLTRSSVYL